MHRQIFRTANDVQFNFQGRGWRPDRDGTAVSSNSGHEFCHIQAFCRGTSGKLGGSTLVAGVGEAKRIFHRSPRLISAHAGAPCSLRKYIVYIYGTRIFSSCVCGRRRQGGCVRATHTGCPPDDHSFHQALTSPSRQNCRGFLPPVGRLSRLERTASLTGREETLSSFFSSLSPLEKKRWRREPPNCSGNIRTSTRSFLRNTQEGEGGIRTA